MIELFHGLPGIQVFSPSWPSIEHILPELKNALPNADVVIEDSVDPTWPLRDEDLREQEDN